MRSLGFLTCVEQTLISIPVSNTKPTEIRESNSAILLSVFFSYAVITHDTAILFIDSAQIDDVVRNHLGPEVEIYPYEFFFQYLKELRDRHHLKDDAVRRH